MNELFVCVCDFFCHTFPTSFISPFYVLHLTIPMSLLFSYKSFLPKCMQSRIQEYNMFTRKRIRCRFKKFIHQFSDCKATVCNLKLKYLMSLEILLPSLYSERFQVTDLSAHEVTIVVMGNKGIQWSKGNEEEGAEEVRTNVPQLRCCRGYFGTDRCSSSSRSKLPEMARVRVCVHACSSNTTWTPMFGLLCSSRSSRNSVTSQR